MKSLRRHNILNTEYFITIVTYDRRPILLNDMDLFWNSWSGQELIGWVILLDHCHIILDIDNIRISDIVHQFKVTFSRHYRGKHGSGRVWQNRFWDHVIRNQEDMNKHLDYIHYNPVKHGLTNNPFEYEHSSLRVWFERGHYERNWGTAEPDGLEGDFGE